MNRLSRVALSAVMLLAVQANGGERGVATDSSAPRRFTLNEAILTALQRNPTLLIAEQEIKRTQGVIIQIRAEMLPHINASGNFDWTDPNLIGARIFGNTTTGTGTTPGSTATGAAASLFESSPSQVRDVASPALAARSSTPSSNCPRTKTMCRRSRRLERGATAHSR